MPFIVAFFTPVTIIIIGNIVTFCLIIRSLLTAGSKVTSIQKKSGYQQARQGIAIMVLLGLTWIFGILAIDDAKVAFQYLFCIFNTLQGLLVFIFFGILPSVTRKKLRNVFERMSKATRRAGQPQNNKEQNTPLNNLGYSGNEFPIATSANKQSFELSSLDKSVSKKALTNNDDDRVEDENLKKVKVNFKFLDPIELNPNVTRYSIRKNGSNFVTTIEINLKTNLS